MGGPLLLVKLRKQPWLIAVRENASFATRSLIMYGGTRDFLQMLITFMIVSIETVWWCLQGEVQAVTNVRGQHINFVGVEYLFGHPLGGWPPRL